MALVTTKKMFAMAYQHGYAIGAFNVNNMEITQGIMAAAAEEKAPVILQISRGARKYASHEIPPGDHRRRRSGNPEYSDLHAPGPRRYLRDLQAVCR